MSLLIRTDVTAVKLHENIILCGIGSSLYVYCKDSFNLLNRIICLKGQKIYGFVSHVNGDKMIVFGGKQFTVTSLNNTAKDKSDIKILRLFDPVDCFDWVHSTTWLDDELIAVLTAHNTVQIWNICNQHIDMTHQYVSSENSILYSGLLLPLEDDLLVFAGTVFSEVIIHTPKDAKPLHYLKGHKGVIFSISAQLERGVIVTTSDDRSVRIWSVNPITLSSNTNTTDYWRTVKITCTHEVYGHLARVMRSCITDKYVISAGEDSAICFWDYKGKLVKKSLTHQNGCIWAVDADSFNLVTGGGDCALVLHPLTIATDYDKNEIFNIDAAPKKIAFTARRNFIILDDSENLIHHDISDKTQIIHRFNHESTYKLLSVSNCKQLIAVADMSGKLDVFAESCKDKADLIKLIDTKLNLGKILSMHWAGNRHLVFCAQEGVMTIICSNNVNLETFAVFILPQSKERWLTSAAMDPTNKTVVVGDRCGTIHVFSHKNKNPIKSFNKVHGRYGPTTITIKNNMFITTGRDGTIKYFTLNEDEPPLAKYMSSKDLEFQWVEKFIDRDQNIVCGFQERIFVVYDIKNYSKLLEVPCGGGHRSWDVIRYVEKVDGNYNEFFRLVYIKNSDIHSHIFQMSKIVSHNVINGSHSKEINCLKAFHSSIGTSSTFYITGGEDTTLRVSSIDSEHKFQDRVVFKHLSNIRTLKVTDYNDSLLIISAGGRAQICIKSIKILLKNGVSEISSEELVDFLVKGTDKQRRNNQTWRNHTVDFDPETRIMDLDFIKFKDKLVLFAGCSDTCLRVFSYANGILQPIQDIFYHNTCILKTVCLKLLNTNILISCSTRGEIVLWDVTNPFEKFSPFFTTSTNKSGINSIDVNILSESQLLVATGGDDNALHLSLIEIPVSNVNSTSVKFKWSTDNFHCSQITGLKFIDNYIVSTSIDQRITLAKWHVGDGIQCEFQTQLYSDVADIQGLEILKTRRESATVCVYGKGMEVLVVPLPTTPH